MSFKHNLATHQASSNLVLKLTTADGISGYGEGIPRDFVTGESLADSYRVLRARLLPALAKLPIGDADQLWPALDGLIEEADRDAAPAACCALEMAVLDCAGKQWQRSLADFLPPQRFQPRYSAVLPMARPGVFENLLTQVRELDLPHVKLKVGVPDDLELIRRVRDALDPAVDLRADANGAWQAAEAISKVGAMAEEGIRAIEQPVAKTDFGGLRAVSRALSIPVVVDESLCTWGDAVRLKAMQACGMFNIRLTKNGGLRAAMRLHEFAKSNGLAAQLGCLVGETGLLSAAGRHLAGALDFTYVEGATGWFLLEEDIVENAVAFGKGGWAEAPQGHGLGVTVNEELLRRYAVDQQHFEVG